MKVKNIKKKSVIFSIISIFVVMLFAITLDMITKFKVQDTELEVTRTRIKILNSIVHDMEEKYIDKIIEISAKNALIGVSRYYYEKNDYTNIDSLGELISTINSTLKNGILPNNPPNNINLANKGCGNLQNFPCLSNRYTFSSLNQELSLLLDSMGFEIKKFNVFVKNINQTHPFYITIEFFVDYHFKDKKNIASWKHSTRKVLNIPVHGIYVKNNVGNGGKITNNWKIDKGPATNPSWQYTEPSVYRKIMGKYACIPNQDCGIGICESGCDVS